VVDRVAFFIAPKIVGGGLPAVEGLHLRSIARAIRIRDLTARRVGDDWLLEGRPIGALIQRPRP
jgi:riboflavin biosynthesis pyrimidine reductase